MPSWICWRGTLFTKIRLPAWGIIFSIQFLLISIRSSCFPELMKFVSVIIDF